MRLVKALPSEYRGPAESGGWAWKFSGLRTKDGAVNAIALPGGRIYLYDVLIKLIDGNQNELASILAAQMGKQLTQMQLSQFAEYQADSLGLQFITAAKYDPAAFPDVLSKINRLSSQRSGILSSVFSTHPPTNKRIEAIQKLVSNR